MKTKKIKKYEVRKNGYINNETDEWRFVETVDIPGLEVTNPRETLKDDEALKDFDFRWFINQ